MNDVKEECVAYVEHAKMMYTQPEVVECGSYYYNKRRMELHRRMCDAYNLNESDTKEFTDNLDKYLKRARDDWDKVAGLLHADLVKLNEGKVNWEELSAERFAYELWEGNWAYRLGFDYCTDTNDFLLKKFRVHFVGWCDGSRLAVRPKSDMVAVMCEDEDGDKFWFHIYKTTFDILRERDKNDKNV